MKLRYGILSEAFVDLNKIQHVELSSRAVEVTSETRHLSPLGSLEQHNVIIRLKETGTLTGLYGAEKEFNTLLLFVDEAERFKKNVEEAIAVS